MRVGAPGRLIIAPGLVAPYIPVRPDTPGEQFEIGAERTCLDDGINFIGLAAMFPLAGGEVIHLAPPSRAGPSIFAARTKEYQLGDIAEVEADPATVTTAILSDLMPDDIGFVSKPQACSTDNP